MLVAPALRLDRAASLLTRLNEPTAARAMSLIVTVFLR